MMHLITIGDGLVVAVLHHQVLSEEPQGLLRWRGCEADDENELKYSSTCRHRL